jgi:hypothetical protein
LLCLLRFWNPHVFMMLRLGELQGDVGNNCAEQPSRMTSFVVHNLSYQVNKL